MFELGTTTWKHAPAWLFFGCCSLLLMLFAATACFGTVAHATLPTPVSSITLVAPSTILAGTPLTITILTDPPVTQAVAKLYWMNTDGAQRFDTILVNGRSVVTIKAETAEVAGTVELVAAVGAQSQHQTLTIVPDRPVEPVVALVGPRSITADGKHWTMLTALPNDRFGNAVADGTPVTVRVLHPATVAHSATPDHREILTATTNDLLAWFRIFSRTTAGRIDMAATSGDAHSPERTVIAVPGPPVAFGLTAAPVQRDADGRRLIPIQTDLLQDQFGNLLLDGTAVTFLITNPDGTTRALPAQSIDGKARIQLQSPPVPGLIAIEALVLNTTSSVLHLDFDTGIGIAPIAVRAIPSEEVLTLIAGPILGPLEQYIPDGSEVRFVLRPEDDGAASNDSRSNGTGSDGTGRNGTGSDGKMGNDKTIELIAPALSGFATVVIRNSTLSAKRYQLFVRAGAGQGETTVEIGQ